VFPVATSFGYDQWGRPQNETADFPLGQVSRSVSRDFVPEDRRAHEILAYSGGQKRTEAYDGAGRLEMPVETAFTGLHIRGRTYCPGATIMLISGECRIDCVAHGVQD
jgi:hypothetical protein